ncbi:hypothetical protein GS8_3393 [Geobacillus stearothermophilus]|uniref:Uncharacterized protein n=1 Tax=Geobacillus stearothermophilus TaxID=1422 RepID=A0ABQ7HAW6_GEOSE|nr:hypothetical protein GS8_3393 [Geobacillus stearothermophilus]
MRKRRCQWDMNDDGNEPLPPTERLLSLRQGGADDWITNT